MNIQTKLIIADILLIGCIGFIGVICLLFFLFYWNKDRAVFYFSILCLSISYWTLSDKYAPLAISFPSLSWLFLMKVEYIAMFLTGASLNLFFSTIFFRFIPKIYVKLIVIIFCFLVILTTFLNELYLTKILVLFLIFMLLSYFFLTYLTLKTKLKERHDTILIRSIMVLGSGIFYAHLFFFLNQDNTSLMYINYGYVVVFLLLSMLLMRRFSKSFRKQEEFNKLVIRQKEEIFVKSKELTSTNLALENNLNLLITANEELDDFNHIVSHDLKSPLIAVHALTSFIQEDLKTTLKKETKQHLSLLQNVTSNMDALINGLLMYSKTGKNSKMKEFFFLNDLLATVIDLLDFKNESIINSPKENIEIYANRIELEHVFQNLISNAIKHNDKECAIINISITKLFKEYVFSVSDNGPGINAKYHDTVFKMFNQLKVNKDLESNGIGLAIVKKLVTKNKGIISLYSKKDTGLNIEFSWRF